MSGQMITFASRPLCGSERPTRDSWLTCSQCYGGHGERETPGLIPNPEAKPLSADGTALETGWESRTPPDNHFERGSEHLLWPPFVFPRPAPAGSELHSAGAVSDQRGISQS